MDDAVTGVSMDLMPLPRTLARWARERPDAVAFELVRSRLTEHELVTFEELDHQAKRMAAFLQTSLGRGDRVLLLLPPGIDYIGAFLGCLYAGVVAVPLYPPRPGARGDRITSVVGSCRPGLVLTSTSTLKLLRDVPSMSGSDAPAVRTVEAVLAADHGAYREVPITGADLAFLQYTSGSTGRPRGVMVTHENLVANERAIAVGFRVGAEDVVLSWLPLYHDMGLIGTTLLPLFLGLRTVLLNTFEFIHDPLSWVIAVARFGATCSGGPNFAYQLLVDHYDGDRAAGLDLRNWRIAFNGAEPVSRRTLDEFAACYRLHGFDSTAFYPCYGLAESTLLVSGGRPGAGYRAGVFDRRAVERGRLVAASGTSAPSMVMVSAGTACEGTSIVIRDQDGGPQADGVVGEVCVQGPSVAEGYWDEQAATEETFHARVRGHDGTFLRTGDLGALSAGQLYIVGRREDLIIVAGRNFYGPDLAAAGSRAHAQLRQGCAAAVQLDGPAVVLVLEVERPAVATLGADASAVRVLGEAVRREVAVECGLDLTEVIFVRPGSIPRTSSGKIRVGETRTRLALGQLRVVGRFRPGEPGRAPGSDDGPMPASKDTGSRTGLVRAVLAETVSRRTGRTLSPADLGLPLAALGMDSLMLATLRGAVERRLGHPIDTALFFGDHSIEEVAEVVGEAPEPVITSVATAATTGDIAASEGQVQQLFYAELFPDDSANNLAWALRFAAPMDEQRMRAAVAALVAKHPALRTTLGPLGSGTQIVHERTDLDWQVRHLDSEDPDEIRRWCAEISFAPFVLTRGPLVRAAMLRTPKSAVLLLSCHHAVVDHWSLEILLADLAGALTTGEPPPPAEQDATVAEWARAQIELSATDAARENLAALTVKWRPLRNEVLFPAGGPPRRRNAAGIVDFVVGSAQTRELYERSRTRGFTPFVTIAAAYLRALHRVTGRSRVVIGTPHHGRQDWRFARTVGYFVNLLPLLGEFDGATSIGGVEERTWRELRSSLAGAAVPFSRLVKELAPDRHGQNPLFQATLTVQQSLDGLLKAALASARDGAADTVHNVEVRSVDIPPRDAAFALSLFGARNDERMVFRLVYQQDLVARSTARGVCEQFTTSLTELLATPPTPEGTPDAVA